MYIIMVYYIIIDYILVMLVLIMKYIILFKLPIKLICRKVSYALHHIISSIFSNLSMIGLVN